ncbi:hypothetical protein B447_04462 [Thauera sp. 27]|uniref:bactofilin family protein n=1 Tax=Thauera sp. 27 TaxID=305700 RepID=UPI0002D07EEF|nr:polymer-forming cytoskeletal protein [Thauera sp. 27]ENO82276.1 hypothetical protein B447_04462 [Thauera sp. 27]
MKARRANYDDELHGQAKARSTEPIEERTQSFAPSATPLRDDAQIPQGPPSQYAPANEALAFGCVVVGRDTQVSGTLQVPGTLRVEGRMAGRVEADEVIILSGGTISGEITCGHAVIFGTFRGDLDCTEELVVMRDAVVEGDLRYYKLVRAETGARLNCTLNYCEEPAPIHNMAPAMDRITPNFDNLPPGLEKEDHELAKEVLPLPTTLMSRLFGSSKPH